VAPAKGWPSGFLSAPDKVGPPAASGQSALLSELNIKDILGPKWAWKMGKLFQAVWFVEDGWQDGATREAIGEANLKVHVRWIISGGDLARKFWWHVTEITLDHLRPSPEWKKAMQELASLNGFGATRRRKQDEEKHRMLREALEEMTLSVRQQTHCTTGLVSSR
jgi:hypothetical protein